MAPPSNYTLYVDIIARVIVPSIVPIVIGFITYQIARKQIHNTGITQFRQQWINNLRDTISEFISLAEFIFITIEDDKVDDAYKNMVKAQYKIELLLNPKEANHNKVAELLDEIRHLAHDDDAKESVFDSKINELLKQSKKVLKEEWNVVKQGK